MRPIPPGRPSHSRKRATLTLTLYAHQFELAVAVILGVSAVRTATRLEDVLGILDPAIAYAWAAFTVVGILGIVVGLFGAADLTGIDPHRRAGFRAVEKAGLYLTAAATAVIGVLVEVAVPFADAWASDVQLGTIVGACIIRALAIRKAERITLDVIRTATASADSAAIVTEVLRNRGSKP